MLAAGPALNAAMAAAQPAGTRNSHEACRGSRARGSSPRIQAAAVTTPVRATAPASPWYPSVPLMSLTAMPLLFYWGGLGPLSINAETVAGTGSTTSDPSLSLNENAVNISALGPGGQLDFYWAINGSPTWNPESVTGGSGLPLP
jgi:hypothetical protein